MNVTTPQVGGGPGQIAVNEAAVDQLVGSLPDQPDAGVRVDQLDDGTVYATTEDELQPPGTISWSLRYQELPIERRRRSIGT